MIVSAKPNGPLWGRSILWLLFLAPFFFWSYGYANQLAATKGIDQSVVFGWERHIPLLPWTIVPYWSIDLFYGLSFLFCRSRHQVDSHALRLLTAQLISVSCFLIFPLRCTWVRPPIEGIFGPWFEVLMGFDQPYNQAPSLHISLLVILWLQISQGTPSPWRLVVHAWALLIGVSVLTTYQHHFFDIPTGALAGFLCIWLWPEHGRLPFAISGRGRTHWRLAAYYSLAAAALVALALGIGRAAWWLAWPLLALVGVAFNYAFCGPAGFQKFQGELSLAVRVLMAPYLWAVKLNSRWWTRHHSASDEIIDGVWLGRMPNARDMAQGQFAALVDLTAEWHAPRGLWLYYGQAWLDLVVPTRTQLLDAAQGIETLRSQTHGKILVACALGYSRSASALLAWLIVSGRAANLAAAEHLLRAKRPQVVLRPAHRQVLLSLSFDASSETIVKPAFEPSPKEPRHDGTL